MVLILEEAGAVDGEGRQQLAEECTGNQLQICERNRKEWAENETGEGSRKMVVSERKKWQAKGKEIQVGAVSVATHLDYVVGEIGRSKAIVIHGVPCQRPMAEIIQDTGVRGIMRARWLLGDDRRLGKVTSSVVVYFDRKVAVGSRLKMRGRWLPIEAYDFNR